MARARSRPSSNKRMTYDDRVELLCAIVQIAEDVIKAAKGMSQKDKRSEIAFGIQVTDLAKDQQSRSTGGLAQLQSDFLVRWNEAVGPEVEEFWKRIKERGLPIERKDVVSDVLARKRIKNRHEYETIVDSLVVLQQIGKISAAQAQALDKMLADFENQSAR